MASLRMLRGIYKGGGSGEFAKEWIGEVEVNYYCKKHARYMLDAGAGGWRSLFRPKVIHKMGKSVLIGVLRRLSDSIISINCCCGIRAGLPRIISWK